MKIENFEFVTVIKYSDEFSDTSVVSLEQGALHHIVSIIKDRNEDAEFEELNNCLKIRNVCYGEIKFAVEVFLTLWNSFKDFR